MQRGPQLRAGSRGVDTVEAPDADEEAEQLIERRQSHAEASTRGEPGFHKLSSLWCLSAAHQGVVWFLHLLA